MQRWPYYALGAVILVAVLLAIFALADSGAEPDDEMEESSAEVGPEVWREEEWWFGGEEEPTADDTPGDDSPRAFGKQGRGPMGEGRGWRGGRRGRPMTEEERQERRERRRARFQRRTTILPLGSTEPTIDADDVFEAFRSARPVLRDCVREAGGFALFRQEPQTRGPRTLSFEVGADGRVRADTISMDPPPPEALSECFQQAFSTAELPPPGEDGARVEMRMPTRRGRGRGDGGVPRGRRPERGAGNERAADPASPEVRPPDEQRRQREPGAKRAPEAPPTAP